MKRADEEIDDQPCSSSETREDVEEISISVESTEEGTFSCTGQFTISTQLINPFLCFISSPTRRITTAALETKPIY